MSRQRRPWLGGSLFTALGTLAAGGLLTASVALAQGATPTPGAAPAAPAASAATGQAQPSAVLPAVSPGSAAWDALTDAQRTALQPLAGEWADLHGTQRDHWLAIAAQYPTLNAEERTRLQERMQSWVRMSPQERLLVRKGFTHAQRFPEAERREKWERYQALPEDVRAALQQRAAERLSAAHSARKHQPVAPDHLLVKIAPGASTVPLQATARPAAHIATNSSRPLREVAAQLSPHTLLPRRP